MYFIILELSEAEMVQKRDAKAGDIFVRGKTSRLIMGGGHCKKPVHLFCLWWKLESFN